MNKRHAKLQPDELLKVLIEDPEKKLQEEEMKEVQKAFMKKHIKRLEDSDEE
jgi:hypothetical protein